MKYYKILETPIGKLFLAEEGGFLTDLRFETPQLRDFTCKETPLLKNTSKQLNEYFSGKRREFDIPLAPRGTEFQKSVWEELKKIPYGETCSYGDIAKRINNPKASRAVGMANNKNPISIIIPCHRVIGNGGKLVGYGGGLDIKEFLLRLEGIIL